MGAHMTIRKPGLRVWAALSLFFLLPYSATAQFNSASIYGTVLDSGGAVVPGATVRAQHIETGTLYKFTTDSLGNYDFPQIRIGAYRVEVEAAGFQKLLRTGIDLDLNQRAKLDLTLQVGNLAETVQVSAEAPLLDTRSEEHTS